MSAYHKLHCTTCKREMVISFHTLQMVVPHAILKKPVDPEHEDQFFLWKGDYCYQCGPEKIGAQLLKERATGKRSPYSPPEDWSPPEIDVQS